MKKRMRILVAALAIVMVLGVCSTAFATATSAVYSGRCNSNFFTSSTLTLSGAKYCRDNNSGAKYEGLSSGATDYTSRFYFANKTTQASGVFSMQTGQVKSRMLTATSNTGYKLKVSNSHSGYTLVISGSYGVSTTAY